jgi:hypothetical protein
MQGGKLENFDGSLEFARRLLKLTRQSKERRRKGAVPPSDPRTDHLE